MYGYQIIKELEQRSQNVFELNEGALYPILHKLENNGCLESYWDETNSSRKRKYYHITSKGGMLLKDKTHEWNFFSKAVDIVLNSAIFDAVVTFPNALVNILEEKVCIKLFQIM